MPAMIIDVPGDQWRGRRGCWANVIIRECGGCGCTDREVSTDTLGMHAVRHDDSEQEYSEGQHAQYRTRSAGPEHARRRPSRNHAVILAACRQCSTTTPETPG
ncbi:hypothetical protein GCM10010244_83440 [Streptomyces coeruleorubidus]|nr:hypothetical protein GCM10010244_83440 [Streptomyces bellus]